MGILNELKAAASDPRRFIGRNGSPCRKCRGAGHYVNRAGGILCQVCSPPAAGDVTLRIEAVEGKWIDADSGFETATPTTPATIAAAIMPRVDAVFDAMQQPTGDYVSRLDRRAREQIETAWHAFRDDYRDWGWIDGAEFLSFNAYAAAIAGAERINAGGR